MVTLSSEYLMRMRIELDETYFIEDTPFGARRRIDVFKGGGKCLELLIKAPRSGRNSRLNGELRLAQPSVGSQDPAEADGLLFTDQFGAVPGLEWGFVAPRTVMLCSLSNRPLCPHRL